MTYEVIVEASWATKGEAATILARFSASQIRSRMVARMHTVDLLEQALQAARRLGYDVRQEWVGTGGGPCEFRGRKRLFVDLAQTVLEQLTMVRDVLQSDPRLAQVPLSPELAGLFQQRRAA